MASAVPDPHPDAGYGGVERGWGGAGGLGAERGRVGGGFGGERGRVGGGFGGERGVGLGAERGAVYGR